MKAPPSFSLSQHILALNIFAVSVLENQALLSGIPNYPGAELRAAHCNFMLKNKEKFSQ